MIRYGRWLLWLAPLLAGCTTQAWYESAKVSAEQQCRDQPAGMQEACLSRLNQKSYDEYQRARKDAADKGGDTSKAP